MQFKNLNTSYKALRAEKYLGRITICALAVTTSLLAFTVLNKKTVTTIIPYTMQQVGYVSADMASESYKTSWGMALAILLGNCNYGSVDMIEKRIAPLLPNDIFEQTLTALRAQAAQFKENRITVRFEINRYIYEPSTDKVFVEGDYYIKAPGLAEKKHLRTYEFIIGVQGYMPQILYINTYEDQARTEQRLKDKKNNASRKKRS